MPITFQRSTAEIDRYRQLIVRFQDGAKAAGATRLGVGSALPYASHWIEEGWRDDPRFGRVQVVYRTPGYTYFVRAAREEMARQLPTHITRGLPAGAPAVRNEMMLFAVQVQRAMQRNLQASVYSLPVPPGRKPGYTRSYELYNSIRVYDLG